MRPEHLEVLAKLLDEAGITDVKPSVFKRYGSARTLYTPSTSTTPTPTEPLRGGGRRRRRSPVTVFFASAP